MRLGQPAVTISRTISSFLERFARSGILLLLDRPHPRNATTYAPLTVQQPEFSWSRPEDLPEMPRHMALVEEPYGRRNVGEMQTAVGQQLLGSLDSPSGQVTVGRHTRRLS